MIATKTFTRRDWLRVAVALSAGVGMTPFHVLAQSHRRKVRITALKAMQIRDLFGTSLIKIETDAGLVGYGEAGASGPMARAFIERFRAQRRLLAFPTLAGRTVLVLGEPV